MSEPPLGAPRNDVELEERLSRPDAGVHRALDACPGDILVLGAGGKMGASLTRMLRRAATERGDTRLVTAVSRFESVPDGGDRTGRDLEPPRIACDLASEVAVRRLPDAPNIIYMVGQKFGTRSNPAATWGINAGIPALVASRFAGSRIVAFSTGNVYALTRPAAGGSREGDALAPIGEYAASCVGRERILEYYATRSSSPLSIVRLNYAVDLRYGVLVDIAIAVREGRPVDQTMAYVNVIWQGDANARAIASLAHASVPPFVVNVTGPEQLSVRAVAQEFGRRLGCPVHFTGTEAPDALLSNTEKMVQALGAPSLPADSLIEWVAEWTSAGGAVLTKPTHFGTRDGVF